MTTRPVVVARAAVVAACALAAPSAATAQGLGKLTVERINAEPALGGVLPTDIAWMPDGRRVTWLKPGRAAGAPADLWSLEASTGKETLLLEGSRLLAPAAGGEAKPLPLRGYSWSPSGEALLVSHGGDVFLVDVRQKTVRALVKTPEEEEFRRPCRRTAAGSPSCGRTTSTWWTWPPAGRLGSRRAGRTRC